MLLTGTIVVGPDGSMKSYELDKTDKIPANITALVSNATQQWHFDPVTRDGQAVTAKARMSLQIQLVGAGLKLTTPVSKG